MTRRLCLILLCTLLIFAVRGEAHKPITSKYTYTEDVFPILNTRCGRCHVAGGIAPMSLLTYKEAIPWAESMRLELTSNHMPPWYAANDTHRLSARELDILLTWATGGTPEGPSRRLSPTISKNGWKLGKPDLLLQAPGPFTLGPDTMEDSSDVLLQAAAETDQWIRAMDVLPGTAAVVRDVTIYTKGPDGQATLVSWFPGDDPAVAPAEAGFRWAGGSELRARIHYKKTWTYDGKSVVDRSSFGVYLLNHAPSHEMHSWSYQPATSILEHDVQVVGLELEGSASDKMIQVVATAPGGSRVALMHLLSRPDWNRRYALTRPVPLAKGSRIEVTGASEARVRLDIIEDRH